MIIMMLRTLYKRRRMKIMSSTERGVIMMLPIALIKRFHTLIIIFHNLSMIIHSFQIMMFYTLIIMMMMFHIYQLTLFYFLPIIMSNPLIIRNLPTLLIIVFFNLIIILS